jgi:hypothetical protein
MPTFYHNDPKQARLPRGNVSSPQFRRPHRFGLGAEDVGVWHYDGGAWSQYAADLETYDAGGIYSFTATDFSGWAVTAIPEPATIALLALGGVAMLRPQRAPLRVAAKRGR